MLPERILSVSKPAIRRVSYGVSERRKRLYMSKEALVVFMLFTTLVIVSTTLAISALNGSGKRTSDGENTEMNLMQISEPSEAITDSPIEQGITFADYKAVTEDGPETESEPKYTDEEVYAIAKTVYGEALVTGSDTEMAAVVWCILNRVDAKGYPNTILGVVTQNRQFHGYKESNPVTVHIEWLVRDVLDRWYSEKEGNEDSGRILPSDYIYFDGDGRHNHFRTEYLSKNEWDWSLESPYED